MIGRLYVGSLRRKRQKPISDRHRQGHFSLQERRIDEIAEH
jgi:hypothetical protein